MKKREENRGKVKVKGSECIRWIIKHERLVARGGTVVIV